VTCHGDELEGRQQIPTLVGDVFLQKWDGQSLDNLFEKMQTTMPATHPGGLERAQNADILAYILSQNNLPAGTTDLPSDHDQLLKIQFTAKK
jgi:S-disulfanyl-L-cysteine oxidoreductase SoxD